MAPEIIDWIEGIVLIHENKIIKNNNNGRFLSVPRFNSKQDINVQNA